MTFDPSEFVTQTTDESFSTSIKPPPEGEHVGIVSSTVPVENWVRSVEITRGDRAGMTVPTLRVPIDLTDEALKAELGRTFVSVNMDMWIDTLEDGITFDFSEGKNVKLGQLRAAVGQNDTPGWHVGMLAGAGPLIARVRHRPDKNDPDIVYAEISRVTPVK